MSKIETIQNRLTNMTQILKVLVEFDFMKTTKYLIWRFKQFGEEIHFSVVQSATAKKPAG
jgi:hypothetical protein